MILTDGEITGISHLAMVIFLGGMGAWFNRKFNTHSSEVKILLNGDLKELVREIRSYRASRSKRKKN